MVVTKPEDNRNQMAIADKPGEGGHRVEDFLQDLGLGYPEEGWARLGILKPMKERQVQGNWPGTGEGIMEGVRLPACTVGFGAHRIL